MKTALITGITGQDGSYLAELLLAKGYRVVGGSRFGKFFLDVTNGQVLFFDVNLFPLHVDFYARQLLGHPLSVVDLTDFNRGSLRARQMLFQFLDLRRDHERAIPGVRIFREIVLMIRLSRPKFCERHDFRRNGIPEGFPRLNA